MGDGGDEARLTIVVAARADEGSFGPCLDAIAAQKVEGVRVVLAVDVEGIEHPAADVVAVRTDALVPELWSAGLGHAEGPIVALTAAALVPADGWIDAILARHDDGTAGVGGPIEPARYRRMTDWAVFFCRYSRYMLPVTDPSIDPAGDNISYLLDVLDKYRDVYEDGFWEPFVHRAMRSDGHHVDMGTTGVVRPAPGVKFGSFCRQRVSHGRAHGRDTSSGESRAQALARCAATPIVPFVMTARSSRRVLSIKRHRVALGACLPLLLWLYTCWSVGELLGRLDKVAGRRGA